MSVCMIVLFFVVMLVFLMVLMCFVVRMRFFFGYGQIIMIEFKRPEDGMTSENQNQEHARLESVGCPVFVFYTSGNAIDFLKRRM